MIGKTTIVSTADLTPDMIHVAIASGWAVHLYKSFFVTSTKRSGVVSVTPRERTAADLRMYKKRKISSPQAAKFLLNVYGKRVIKDANGRRIVTLAYL